MLEVMEDRGVRFLALLLVVGGLVGIGTSVFMGYGFLPQHWVYGVIVAAFLVLFVWSLIVGVRLWRGDPRGIKWSKILFSCQVPILTVPGFSYEYFTGVSIKIVGGEVDSNVALNLGAGAEFFLDTRITSLVFGINIFAVLALVYLFFKLRPDGRIGLSRAAQVQTHE